MIRFAALVALLLLPACNRSRTFETDHVRLEMDARGHFTAFVDKASGRDFLDKAQPAPLLAIRMDGRIALPSKATWAGDSLVTLSYLDPEAEADVRITRFSSHLAFEVVRVEPFDQVEVALWGPYPTTIRENVGEAVGVVFDESFAFGIQSLNLKTIGGYPHREDDTPVRGRGEAADSTETGSVVQAYCRNRSRDRVAPNWGQEAYLLPAHYDGGPVGSRIALFGAPAARALETIGEIERVEGLAHPEWGGRWLKTAREATESYLILDFGESTIDRALSSTKAFGFRRLYHPDPFESWGHFEPKRSDFPSGVNGMRRVVERAAQDGVLLGVHTLSNFITVNDPYVTPRPDPRLGRIGSAHLAEPVSARSAEIAIDDPTFFRGRTTLQTWRMEDELVRCAGLSDEAPWRLVDCERGAFDTSPSNHADGIRIDRLADHDYRVFLSDIELQEEIAIRLADLFNQTGLRQISFDGIEGNLSAGLGEYGVARFAQIWYDRLDPAIREDLIVDASRTTHFFWHVFSRMNWGEPWYAGFRESQTDYRVRNQVFFQRNLMPAMLGWFQLRDETSLEDIEWMLARAAGFDAGFAFVASFETLERHGFVDEIAGAVTRWESARLKGQFGADQKERLRDLGREFRLEAAEDGSVALREVRPIVFRHENRPRQPGEPGVSALTFENPFEAQPLRLMLQVEGGARASDIRIELDGRNELRLPVVLGEGDVLRIDGTAEAVVYGPGSVVRARLPLDASVLELGSGSRRLAVDATMEGGANAALRIETRLVGALEPLQDN